MYSKPVIYLFLLFLGVNAYSQQKTVIHQIAKGDLNKDGIPDLAIVKAGKNGNITNYILEIYFLDKDGNKS